MYVVHRPIIAEKQSYKQAQNCMEIMDLIQHAGLLNTVLRRGPFYPQFFREFIVNLPSSFDDCKLFEVTC